MPAYVSCVQGVLVCVCAEVRGHCRSLPPLLPTSFFLRQGHSLNLELPAPDCLAIELHGSPCLCVHNTRVNAGIPGTMPGCKSTFLLLRHKKFRRVRKVNKPCQETKPVDAKQARDPCWQPGLAVHSCNLRTGGGGGRGRSLRSSSVTRQAGGNPGFQETEPQNKQTSKQRCGDSSVHKGLDK